MKTAEQISAYLSEREQQYCQLIEDMTDKEAEYLQRGFGMQARAMTDAIKMALVRLEELQHIMSNIK